MPTGIPNNVERGGQTALASFNIGDNKKNVEFLLKESLNAFRLVHIQHRFIINLTCFNRVEGREWNVQQNQTDVEVIVEAVCL